MKERSHSVNVSQTFPWKHARAGQEHTGKGTVEGFLARVAAHMGSQRVAAGMGDSFSSAVAPFAAVLLLARADVLFVQVLDQVIHIIQVARLAAFPFAHRHLLLAEFILCRHAGVVRRCWHGAICVLGQLAQVVGRRHGGRIRGGAVVQAQAFVGTAGWLVVVVGRVFDAEAAASFDVVGKVVAGVVGKV